MHTVTVWNRASTNFDANSFVRANGTDTVRVESEAQAHQMMGAAMHDSGIDRAIIEGPNGRLTWERHQQSEPQGCDGPEDDECDCDDCDCGGCPGDEEEDFGQ